MNEYATYLFRKGDSVLFTYKENIPYANILNREVSFQESNYDIFVREKVTNNRISARDFYSYYLIREILIHEEPYKSWGLPEDLQMDNLIEKYLIQSRKQALDLAIEEIIHEYRLQDTLHASGLLSDFEFDYRRYITASFANHFFVRDTSMIENTDYKIILTETDLSDKRFSKIDSLWQPAQHQFDLNAKVDDYLKNIKRTTIEGRGSGRPSPHSYFARFDTISNLDFLSAKSKRSFLINELKKIFETGDRNDIEKYCEKFISITDDRHFVNKLLAENKMDFSYSDELLLIDRFNNQTNLQQVLERNRGKVVYIDFWASWCAPCIAIMPEAKLLREEYKDKDITFIYLAINDMEDRWKADELKFEVTYLSESYFITNSKTAHLIADLKVRTIPRYLLYNKKGELVHLNAPGPGDTAIRPQIDKLLQE